MADTGPCGPDSEIHIDLGPEFCDLAGTTATSAGQRGLQALPGTMEPGLHPIQSFLSDPTRSLPSKHVDTGMGFERVVSVLQRVDSNYRRSVHPILSRIQRLAGHTLEQRQELLTRTG